MARKKDSYKNHLNKTVEQILALPRRQRRFPAMALYLQNFDMSVQEVAELLDIPEGTAKDWAAKDEWAKTREEIKEKIKDKIKVTAETEHTKIIMQIISNLLQKFLEASLNPNVKVIDIRDLKFLSEALEKNYKILGLLNVIEEPTQKHEVEYKGINNPVQNLSDEELRLLLLGLQEKEGDGE
ncbi:Putative ATPase subunit of terminase (gpP-like) [Aneurinibacillus thermoaerophilus]|uniref:Putative ATPase subunit of terminase (GpP-like) n=1 Tax=Aneurinibacillus thermoaerophilus TaxID=143495 RepID=A0A1G7WPF4_ANETH|nr:hypothetical protein [Aneurinibacillus thermoaerophilus]SDG73855.1 Putative ATPase subunit of terminase (gpP-like) [Aneurinibacillus thermoaerophilus]